MPREGGWLLMQGTHEDGRYTERPVHGDRPLYSADEALAWLMLLNVRVVFSSR